MIRPLSLALWAIALGFTGSAAMATNTITFQGQVSSQTCQAKVSGQDNAVVLMPPVSVSELKSGQSAGTTSFRLEVSGCTAPDKEEPILVRFVAPYLSSGGNLANIAEEEKKAKNVVIRLSDAGGEVFPLGGNPVLTDRASVKLKPRANSTGAEYIASYYAEGGDAEPGKVKAVIHYTLGYP